MADLIVFYSYTGKSRQDAEWLRSVLKADLEEIVEEKPRSVVSGLRCALDSFLRRSPAIRPLTNRAEVYDRVVLVCPVWAGRLAGPVRTWLKREGRQARALALIVQSGTGRNIMSVVNEIEAITGRTPAPVAGVTESDFGDHLAESRISAFATLLSSSAAHIS